MTDLITQTFVPGFRTIDGSDLNTLKDQINAALAFTGRYCTLFDDFLGDTLSTAWDVQKGSDAATVNFAPLANGLSGIARAVTGANAGVSMATNGVQFETGLMQFEADQGSLVFEARVRATLLTNLSIFIGLTDQVAALEAAYTLSVVTYTSNATDAVGFLYDSAATTKTLRLVGVANDVDAANIDTSNAWAAATWMTFRIEIDTAGLATFYINGTSVGKLATAVRTTIPLIPVVSAFTRSAASTNVDIDYVLARQARL